MFQEACHKLIHLFIDMFSYPALTRYKSKAKQNKKQKQPAKQNVRSNMKVTIRRRNCYIIDSMLNLCSMKIILI